jgi:hypothetical protein
LNESIYEKNKRGGEGDEGDVGVEEISVRRVLSKEDMNLLEKL